MAAVIPFESFQVCAFPKREENLYSVIVQRLPLGDEGVSEHFDLAASYLREWFREHACADCAEAIDNNQCLNPAHCGISAKAIERLGVDPSKI